MLSSILGLEAKFTSRSAFRPRTYWPGEAPPKPTFQVTLKPCCPGPSQPLPMLFKLFYLGGFIFPRSHRSPTISKWPVTPSSRWRRNPIGGHRTQGQVTEVQKSLLGPSHPSDPHPLDPSHANIMLPASRTIPELSVLLQAPWSPLAGSVLLLLLYLLLVHSAHQQVAESLEDQDKSSDPPGTPPSNSLPYMAAEGVVMATVEAPAACNLQFSPAEQTQRIQWSE